jgi:L-asparaginase II
MLKPAFQIEITRGSNVESRHSVHAAIAFSDRREQDVFGSPDLLVFPRSSLKPIQALPLILTGAADRFQISSEELALACASHRGEPFHINPIRRWLTRLGLSESQLECGTHPPANHDSWSELIRSLQPITAIHNNCSGKHTGMLMTALHQGGECKDYVSLNHPVQQRILKLIELFTETPLSGKNLGIDGCSIPAPCVPLSKLAQAMADFADPHRFDSTVAEACRRVFAAFVQHPKLSSGTGHYCAEMMSLCQGRVLLKGGAEGVMVGAIPELKVGFAVKTLDGQTRASDYVTSLILEKLGVLGANNPYLHPKIYNWQQTETGLVRAQ